MNSGSNMHNNNHRRSVGTQSARVLGGLLTGALMFIIGTVEFWNRFHTLAPFLPVYLAATTDAVYKWAAAKHSKSPEGTKRILWYLNRRLLSPVAWSLGAIGTILVTIAIDMHTSTTIMVWLYSLCIISFVALWLYTLLLFNREKMNKWKNRGNI